MPINWDFIRDNYEYLDSVCTEARAELLYDAFLNAKSLNEWERYLKDHPPSPATLAICLVLGKEKYLSTKARNAANSMHGKPGGYRDKKKEIREIWASGKYTNRDLCALEECDAVGLAYSTARKALVNEPPPAT